MSGRNASGDAQRNIFSYLHQERISLDCQSLPLCKVEDLQYNYINYENTPPFQQFQESGNELSSKLFYAGFALDNYNLMCIQMINALQIQADLLEKALFHNVLSPILRYGIFEQVYSAQKSKQSQIKIQQFLGQITKTQAKISNKRQVNLFSPIQTYQKMEDQEQIYEILRGKWQFITSNDKVKYLSIRKQIDQLKKVITESLTHKAGNQHICLLCGVIFENGRQLGGHMSRKHPGNSTDYTKKRQVHSTKVVERQRRKYFKNMNKGVLKKQKIIKKIKKMVKLEQ